MYHETLVVDRSITLLGENRDYTVIEGRSDGWVIRVLSSSVTIKEFTIRNLEYGGKGIRLNNVEDCVISNNRINTYVYSISLSSSSNNFLTHNIIDAAAEGLTLEYSNNNIIQGNKISNCSRVGIYIYSSDRNIVADNILNNNNDGLYLTYTSNDTILNNTITSSYGFGLSMYACFNNTLRGNRLIGNYGNFYINSWRWDATDFYHDIDTSNTINGKPIYYLVEEEDVVIDESTNAGFVALVSCNNIEVRNLVLENNSCGVLLVNTTHSIISNIKAYNNMYGIKVDSSSYNILSNNTLSNNEDGVVLWISHNNLIFNNSITGSEYYGILVNGYNYPYISNSSHNIITGNIIKDASGNNNNGTIHGASWAPGKSDMALSFDGVDDYVDCGNADKIRLVGTSFTIEAWIYPERLDGLKVIIGNDINKAGGGWCLLGTTYGRLVVYIQNVVGYSTAGSLKLNKWNHIVFTFDDSDNTGTFYVNGVKRGSRKFTKVGNVSRRITIGIDPRNRTGYCFKGIIDEVKIYNKALTREKVSMITQGIKKQDRERLIEELKSRYSQILCKRPYLLWKKNPWLNLPPDQLPSLKTKECKEVNFIMGINEYKSFSFVLTNFAKQEMKVKLKVKDNKFPISIRECYLVKASKGKKVNDALPLLETLTIPSLQSREIWLTLYSKGVKPGNYKIDLVIQPIKPENLPPSSITLKIKVYPITLPTEPKDMPIYTLVWDYIDHAFCFEPELQKEVKEDLFSHYITVAVIHPKTIPWPIFNKEGKMDIDYTKCDKALNMWLKGIKPKAILFYTSATPLFRQFGGEWMSETWKKNFSLWLSQFVSYLKEKGLTYDDFFFHTFDESTGKKFIEFAAFLKKVDPNVKIFTNPTYGTTIAQIEKIEPYTDIWCPFLYVFKDKKECLNLMRKKGKFFWTYANPPSRYPKTDSPYQYYRLIPWYTWYLGMKGAGFWTYLTGSSRSGYGPWLEDDGEKIYMGKKKITWSVVYPLKEAPSDVSRKENFIPSKRWEGWREGVIDYIYINILKETISEARNKGVEQSIIKEAEELLKKLPEKVAKEMLQAWPKMVKWEESKLYMADKAREKIIQEIFKLKYEN